MEEDKTQTDDFADYYGSVMPMNKVDESLQCLIDSVLGSEEYMRYQDIKTKIKSEPEKEQAIHRFRKRNFLLQRNKDNIDLFSEIDKLEQEFAQFRREPLVEEYLSAEMAVCRMVQKINHELMAKIDLEPISWD